MAEFLFDIKLFASVRVHAEDESEARNIVMEAFACATANFGVWPDGDPIVAEASVDGEPDLIEIDGEPA